VKSKFVALACGITLLTLVSSYASAQTEPGANSGSPDVAVVDPDGGRSQVPHDSYGIQDRSVTWIPMAAFQPREGASTWTYQGDGYVSRATGADLLWAPLTIPNGALIDTVRLWMYDQSAGSMTVYLTQFGGIGDSFVDIGSAVSSGTGETSIAFFPAHTTNYSSYFYVIYVRMPIDAALRAKGVRVLWYRQVSPAPATATFTDVPTSSAYFRYVEAIVASGLTAGCTPSTYCPNNPVTRGQMAVFLSVALGLHHPL
jgi:hypothetical protein